MWFLRVPLLFSRDNEWTCGPDALWAGGWASGATGPNAIGWTENRKMVQSGGRWQVNLSSSRRRRRSSSLPQQCGLLWFKALPIQNPFLSVESTVCERLLWSSLGPPANTLISFWVFFCLFCRLVRPADQQRGHERTGLLSRHVCWVVTLSDSTGRCRDVQYRENFKTVFDHRGKVFMATNVSGSVWKLLGRCTLCVCVCPSQPPVWMQRQALCFLPQAGLRSTDLHIFHSIEWPLQDH